MNSIVIDFGGTAIKLALIHDDVIIKRDSIPAYSANGLAPRLPDTEKAVRRLLDGEDIRNYTGIGVAMPGIVDPLNKKVLALYGKYEDSLQMDLSAWCRDTFGLPMILEMDSKAALLGEIHYGCGIGYKDAAMLIFGTGVGTAVMIDGKLLASRNYTAGVLSSHIIIDIHGRKCTCPNTGCLEAEASGWALEELIRDHPGFSSSGLASEETLNFLALSKWCKKSDPVALDVLHHCVESWRAGILNMIHAYDPALVILSGGIMKFDGMYEMLTEGLSERVWPCCGHIDIKQAQQPEDSVLYGLHYSLQTSLSN